LVYNSQYTLAPLSTQLYIVPTPIGNLEDITLRAIKILQQVDGVVAEDTRNTGMLLKHLGIQKQLYSHHSHNEHTSTAGLLKLLKAGKMLAVVSDAGTPVVSDPGFLLVREAIKEGIEVETLPGPTAFVPALVNSGLPADRFTFEGFLPQKKGRQTRLKQLAEEERTMVFYESPHRLMKTLEQFAEVFGSERNACVSRELTKVFEENIRGNLAQIIQHYATNTNTIKGEIVIVVAGHEA
jgi:16S rRNA (cytidine1402-2'-O)-methyltransferase